MDVSKLLTTRAAAPIVGIDDSSIRRLCAKSRTADWTGPEIGVKLGHDWLLRPEDIEALKNRPKPNREYKRKA